MTRRWMLLLLALAVVAAEVTVSVILIAQGEHNDTKWATLSFAVPPGVAFALAGTVAVWRRPANRTGFYLGAVGYLWFIGALFESSNEWLFAFAVVFQSLAFIPFVLLVFAFPTGHLQNRAQRIYLVVVSIALLVVPLVKLLVDRTPEERCVNGCRESPIAIVDSERLGDVVTFVGGLIGIGLIVAAAILLVQRWRVATHAHRNALRLVLVTSVTAIAMLLVLNAVDAVSPGSSDPLSPLFLVAFTAVPISFLVGILRIRLARSSVAALVVELGRGAPIQAALARSLGDPSLEVIYPVDDGAWIDSAGQRVPAPETRDARSRTDVAGDRGLIATLVHDPSLDEEPELVDAVTAASSISLENARLDAALRSQSQLTETIGSTVPSLLVLVDLEGRVVKANPAALAAAGLSRAAEVNGRPFWEIFIDPGEREGMIARFRAAAPEFPRASYENTFTNRRDETHVIAWESAPVLDGEGRVTGIVAGGLDITERKQRELELARERDLRQRQEAEVRASRARIVRAGDEARQRLERNLHDGAQQRLVSLSVSLRLIEGRLESDPGSAAEMLVAARAELSEALDELRELARGIHPAILSDRGLLPAVESLASRLPIDVEITGKADGLPDTVEAALYYVVAESLTNVVRYAKTDRATVALAREGGLVAVVVSDEGEGGADLARGTGLRGLQDRVAALDGRFALDSAPGRGTRVRAEIPVAKPAPG
ncbi:MAG: histidine kinase [Gaiellales bacterium]